MTNFVVDCSVAIQWYVEEEGYLESRALLDSGHAFFAPTLALAEFANVCWKKVNRGEMARSSAEQALASFRTDLVEFVDMAPTVPNALQFALDNGITVYDSLYAVLALAGGAPLVTHDARLHGAVAAHDPALAIFPADLPA